MTEAALAAVMELGVGERVTLFVDGHGLNNKRSTVAVYMTRDDGGLAMTYPNSVLQGERAYPRFRKPPVWPIGEWGIDTECWMLQGEYLAMQTEEDESSL